jgi:hypothetical protein
MKKMNSNSHHPASKNTIPQRRSSALIGNLLRTLTNEEMQKSNNRSDKTSFITNSLISSGALLTFYLTILVLGNSWEHALQQVIDWWPWVSLQTIGFGTQVGMFLHIRDISRAGNWKGPSSSLAVGGGMSAGSMVACCLHHVTDVLPIVGFSAATLFLTQYQSVFMSMGVLFNIVGLLFMTEMLYNYSDFELFGARIDKIVTTYDFKRIRNISAYASALIFILLMSSALWSESAAQSGAGNEELVNDLNGVTFTIKPIGYEREELAFSTKIDTHSGALDFDMTEISQLVVSGTSYEPLFWDGSPPGGHHRSGILVFPNPTGGSGEMSLTIIGVGDVPERVFHWGGSTTVASKNIFTQAGISVIIISAIALSLRSKRDITEPFESLFESEYQKFKGSKG